MTDAEKLRMIADWFDGVQSGTVLPHPEKWEGTEVQRDLRRIAERLEGESDA